MTKLFQNPDGAHAQALRWSAVVTYRTDAGPLDVIHDFEELSEVHGLVERGPDWNTIVKIEITLTSRRYDVTIEQAEQM